MAIYLSEADVREILTMEIALKAVEDSFQMLADGSATQYSRQRLNPAANSLSSLHGRSRLTLALHGPKDLHQLPARPEFHLPLFHIESGHLLAMIEANYLARSHRRSQRSRHAQWPAPTQNGGIIGTGLQSQMQL